MSNQDFINKYGRLEFYDMCKNIAQDLQIAKIRKKISGYRLHNKTKKVTIYKKDKTSITIDFATAYCMLK